MKNGRVFSTSEGRYRRPWTTRIPVASELEEFRRTSCLLWLRILMLAGRDLRTLALNRRQQLLRDSLGTSDLVQLSETVQIPARRMIAVAPRAWCRCETTTQLVYCGV